MISTFDLSFFSFHTSLRNLENEETGPWLTTATCQNIKCSPLFSSKPNAGDLQKLHWGKSCL